MSTTNICRPSKNDITADSKTEAKHSVKNLVKTETTVAKTPNRYALTDTTIFAVEHFTVSQQQFKK